MKRCGLSCRHTRNASAVFKIFVLHPKKTFATISAQSGRSYASRASEFVTDKERVESLSVIPQVRALHRQASWLYPPQSVEKRDGGNSECLARFLAAMILHQ